MGGGGGARRLREGLRREGRFQEVDERGGETAGDCGVELQISIRGRRERRPRRQENRPRGRDVVRAQEATERQVERPPRPRQSRRGAARVVRQGKGGRVREIHQRRAGVCPVGRLRGGGNCG